MKSARVLALLLLAAGVAFWACEAQADDILANSDFSQGKAHWKGDGQDASGTSIDDVSASMSSQGSVAGMSVTLKPQDWTLVWQTFHTREAALTFSMNYKTSADFVLTTGPGGAVASTSSVDSLLAYILQVPLRTSAMSGGLGDPTHPSPHISPASAVVFIADPSQNAVVWSFVKLTGAPSGTITTALLDKLMPHEEKTLYIALPPGTGTVTFANISLAKPDAQPAASDNPFQQ
jgi:hypothetical protein